MQKLLGSPSYTHGDILRPVSEDALDPKDRSCCICYQPFRPTSLTQGGSEVPVQLPCAHVFGESCIVSWTFCNNSCPLCRRQVFEIGDHPANRNFSISHYSSAGSSIAADRHDIWLDTHVWERPTETQLRETVSSIDIELLVELYTSDHSTMHSNSEPHPSHRGLTSTSPDDVCPRTNEEAERFTPPTTTQPRPTETFDFNLTELGAQFASLNYQYKQWMDEYLNEPSLDDHFFVT